MNVYCTYEEVKAYVISQVEAGEVTFDDPSFIRFCIGSSRLFDTFAQRQFYPTKETHYFDHPAGFVPSDPPLDSTSLSLSVGRVPGDVLRFDKDLLEVHTFTTKNGDTTVSASDYLLMHGPERYQPSPYDRLKLKPNGAVTSLQVGTSELQANTVTGIWGWHNDWSNGWAEVDEIENNPLTASSEVVTVNDVNGVDEIGLTPRFKVQQLIRLGSGASAEYGWITAIADTGNTLTVKRGKNGTTAAIWPQNTKIYIYRPPADLVQAMLELVAHQYKRREAVGRAEDRGVVSPTGLMLLPSRLPSLVQDMINRLMQAGI